MADENIDIRIRLQNAARFAKDSRVASASVRGIKSAVMTTDRAMNAASRRMRVFSGGLRRLGMAAKVGAFALAGGLVLAIRGSIRAFSEAEKVQADQAQALKTTGGAAKVTAKHLNDMATAQSMLTGFDDEAIASSQTMLLTFTKIRNGIGKQNQIFDQAGVAVQDYARRFGKDLPTAAITVGKALNDPVKGMSALSKVGVTFDEQQKKTVKALVAAGDVMGAQKMILKELATETGGAAAAYGRTFAGSIDRAKVMVGNLGESIGAKLAPHIMTAVNFLTRLINRFNFARKNGEGWGSSLAIAIGSVTGHMATARSIFAKMVKVGRWLKGVLGDLFDAAVNVAAIFAGGLTKDGESSSSTIKTMGDVVAKLASKLKDLTTWLRGSTAGAKTMRTILKLTLAVFIGLKIGIAAAKVALAAFRIVMMAVNLAMRLNPIGLVITGLFLLGAAFVLAYKKIGWFRNAVNATWTWIKKHWPMLLAILMGPVGIAVLLIVKNWDRIKKATSSLWGYLKSGFNSLVGFFTGLPARISAGASSMFNGIKDAFRSALNWIVGAWNNLELTLKLPGGKKFSIGTPNLPTFSGGGVMGHSGLAVVGERGPEVAAMPRGTRVVPNSEVRQMMMPNLGGMIGGAIAAASGGGETTIPVSVQIDGREVARAVGRHVKNKVARR